MEIQVGTAKRHNLQSSLIGTMALTELGVEGYYLNIVKTVYGISMSNNHNK